MCRTGGGGRRRKTPEKAEAEAAENRKHFIHPAVRFLTCKQTSGGNSGPGGPHLGTAGKPLQHMVSAGFCRSTQHACSLVLNFLVEGLAWQNISYNRL